MAGLKRVLPYVGAVLLTVAVVYLTPLKWITIVEPTIKDIEPVSFQGDFAKDSSHYIFIDVRSGASYDTLHAAGSINVALNTLYDQRRVLPKNGKEIVLICSDGRASGVAYSYLQHYGFFNIERIKGGVTEWVSEGLPVESSSSVGKPVTLNP